MKVSIILLVTLFLTVATPSIGFEIGDWVETNEKWTVEPNSLKYYRGKVVKVSDDLIDVDVGCKIRYNTKRYLQKISWLPQVTFYYYFSSECYKSTTTTTVKKDCCCEFSREVCPNNCIRYNKVVGLWFCCKCCECCDK